MKVVCCILSAIVICFNLLATPSWESPALHNGQLRLDGQLYKRMGLGMLSGSPEFLSPKTTYLRCSSICEAAGSKTLRFERIKEIKESFSLGHICIMAKQKALSISNHSNIHLQIRLYLEYERLHFHITSFVLFCLKHLL